jgi:hypothetical protein
VNRASVEQHLQQIEKLIQAIRSLSDEERIIIKTACGCTREICIRFALQEVHVPLAKPFNVRAYDSQRVSDREPFLERKFVWNGKKEGEKRVFEEAL